MSEEFPVKYNITIRRGRDLSLNFEYTDADGVAINMTGYSIAAEIRATKARDGDLIATFTTVETSLSTGLFGITLSDTITAALTDTAGYWDLKITDAAGLIETFAEGRVDIIETVTA